METPSRHSFDCDGSTRVFPIPSPIKGDNYCRLEVDGTIINDRTKYDIVNNSIVFIDAADVPDGSQLDVLVVQSEEAIGQLTITTNIDIVATNIDDINTVAENVTDVNTLADIEADIQTLADIEDGTDATDAIQTVAGISSNVTTVAGISSNVTTVAGNTTNINTVAGNNANVTTVATNISNVNDVAAIDANVTTVAGIDADVTTVAGISADVSAVAAIDSDVTTVSGINADVTAVAADATDIGTVATDIANVNTVAGISTNVTTVAGNTTNINAVAGNNTNITTVAGISGNVTTVAGISSDITAVAGIASDIQDVQDQLTEVQTVADDLNEAISEIETVAANIADVDTVATNIANVNSVAGDIANVNTVASNLTDINAFADTYYISATAPTSPTEGDLWFDTANDTMKVYNGSTWQNAGSSVNGTEDRFKYVATSGQTVFSGTDAYGGTLAYDAGYIDVYLNGVHLDPSDYTATDGTTITLASGATLNDELYIVAFGTFVLADHYDKTQSDARYLSSTASIEDLADVNAMTPTDGQLLTWDNGNSRWDAADAPVSLPDQTGNSGKYLTTDGSTASWANTGAAAGMFWENDQNLTADYTITSGKNAGTFGAITIDTGVTVTVPTGSTWTII